MPYLTVVGFCAYLTWSLTSLGLLLDGNHSAWYSELLRSVLYISLKSTFESNTDVEIKGLCYCWFLIATFAIGRKKAEVKRE